MRPRSPRFSKLLTVARLFLLIVFLLFVGSCSYSGTDRVTPPTEPRPARVGVYDPATDTWTSTAPLTTARRVLGVGVLNGTLFAVGGVGPDYQPLPMFEAYNEITNSWTTKAPVPTPRWAPGVAALNGRLYTVGGSAFRPAGLQTAPMLSRSTRPIDGMALVHLLQKLLGSLFAGLACVVVILIYGAGCYRDLVHPYRSDNYARSQAKRAGLELAIDNQGGDLVLPWTWFYPPSFSLAFVRPGTLYRAGGTSDTVFAPVFWTRREEDGRVTEAIELQAYDCRLNRFTTVMDVTELTDQNLHPYTEGPIEGPWMDMSNQMKDYFCQARSIPHSLQ